MMGNDVGSGVSSVCFDFFSTYVGSSVIQTHTSNGFIVITHYCPILLPFQELAKELWGRKSQNSTSNVTWPQKAQVRS